MADAYLAAIESLRQEIRDYSIASPRLTRTEAASYLRMSYKKLMNLKNRGVIKEHTDDFNVKYFLREELNDYLRSN